MTNELKPCPFCGGLPYPETTVCDNSVRCTICGARIIRLNDNNCAIQKPSAIDTWNTRATATDQPVSISLENTAKKLLGPMPSLTELVEKRKDIAKILDAAGVKYE